MLIHICICAYTDVEAREGKRQRDLYYYLTYCNAMWKPYSVKSIAAHCTPKFS